MIDLEKEFRTLRLLAKALIIIGAGLTVCGFGAALLMNSGKEKPKKPAYVPPPDDSEVSETTPPPSTPPAGKNYKEKFSSSTTGIILPTGILGILFLILGGLLRWIIRNNIDDGEEPEQSPELFKAYAEQLVVAEKLKEKQRKRLK